MPTEEENVQYLYLVLTHGGAPAIDWDAVGKAMDLKKGAVSKRWSRLKTTLEKGDTPNGSAYKFLWICLKHSTRDKAMNWNEIAEKCGTTAGAASKRYSRMKQAFEAGDAAPENNPALPPAPKTPSKAKPKKSKATTIDSEASPTPKRKRATLKKKVVNEDEDMVKPEPGTDDEDEDVESPTKKAKVTKPKVTPKSKSESKTDVHVVDDADTMTAEPTTPVKDEDEDESNDTFIDAKQWVNDLADGPDEDTEEEQAARVNEWLSETV